MELNRIKEVLDEKGIKSEIADRVIAQIGETKPKTEVAQTKSDLNNSDSTYMSSMDAMKKWLSK